MEAVQRQREDETSSKPDYRERLFYDHLNAAAVAENDELYLEDYQSGVRTFLGKPISGSAVSLLEEAAQEGHTLDQLKAELEGT